MPSLTLSCPSIMRSTAPASPTSCNTTTDVQVPHAVKTVVLTGDSHDAPALPEPTSPKADVAPDTPSLLYPDSEEALQLENVKQLRARCRAADINAAGRKSELIARLLSASRSS